MYKGSREGTLFLLAAPPRDVFWYNVFRAYATKKFVRDVLHCEVPQGVGENMFTFFQIAVEVVQQRADDVRHCFDRRLHIPQAVFTNDTIRINSQRDDRYTYQPSLDKCVGKALAK